MANTVLRRSLFSTCTALVFLAVSYVVSFYLPLYLWHKNSWLYPVDLYATLRDAHMILWGGYSVIYSIGSGLIAPPLGALSLTPLAFLIDVFKLFEPFPFSMPFPSAWPVSLAYLGLYQAAWAYSVITFYEKYCGIGKGAYVFSFIVSLCGAYLLFPWGHPEDIVALLLCVSIFILIDDGKIVKASYLTGLALGFQPFALLFLIPLWIIKAPNISSLLRSSMRIAIIPVTLYVPILIADSKSTLQVLLHQPNFPKVDHLTIVGRLAQISSGAVPAGPFRGVMIALAVVVGVWGRRYFAKRTPDWRAVFFVCVFSLSLRIIFEPVMVPYYVVAFGVLGMFLAPSQLRLKIVYMGVTVSLFVLILAASSMRLVALQYSLILYAATFAMIGVFGTGVLVEELKNSISNPGKNFHKDENCEAALFDGVNAALAPVVERSLDRIRFQGSREILMQDDKKDTSVHLEAQ